MEDPIVNRVAKSPLITIDLEEIYPDISVQELDIAGWLEGGFILKEKDFRNQLESADLTVYQDKIVSLFCSTDAILPGWAFMLVASKLQPLAKLVVLGSKTTAQLAFAQQFIAKLDLTHYERKPVIIKGCSKRDIPEQALIALSSRLHGLAKSVMFGEACSSVPIYKQK